MLWLLSPALQFGLVVLLACAAWYWGAGPERAIATTMLCMFVADRIYHAIWIQSAVFNDIDIGHAVIDLAVGASFYTIALKANRNYPLWVAALQIFAILSHVIRDASPLISPLAYSIVMIGPSYPQMLIAIMGLILHAHRTKRDRYPSWLVSSTPISDPDHSNLPKDY